MRYEFIDYNGHSKKQHQNLSPHESKYQIRTYQHQDALLSLLSNSRRHSNSHLPFHIKFSQNGRINEGNKAGNRENLPNESPGCFI